MKKLIAIVLTVAMLAMGLGGALAYAAEDDPATPNLDESSLAGNTTYYLTDSGWSTSTVTNDCTNGWGDDDWELTLTSAKDLTVTVADCCIRGDYYGMYVNGIKIGQTPVVVGPPPIVYTGLSVGSATVSLLPGVYTITVQDQYFVDVPGYPSYMCPAGFTVSGALSTYTGPEAIDIKPWSDPNSINVNKKKGVTPVAILGSATFDVTTVDVTTLDFEGASPAHDLTDPDVYADHLVQPWLYSYGPDGVLGGGDDVYYTANEDAYVDLVSHYRTQETGLSPGDTSACLTFEIGGLSYMLCDSVRTVPPGP